MRRLARIAACTLLLWATGVSAQEADPTSDLLADMGEARALIAEGQFDEAHDRLLTLVREHEQEDELLLQLHRVKELLKRCAFLASNEPPEATSLIAGDLRSYDRRSGKIKVRYERDASKDGEEEADEQKANVKLLMQLLGLSSEVGGNDFTWAAGAPMHPIVFSGPYTVEIKGVMPDKDDVAGLWFSNPQMVINAGDEGIYVVHFGTPRTKFGFYGVASITHTLNGKRETLDEDKSTPLDIGKKYSIKVVVNKKGITASANGRTFLKCKKQDDQYGQFGFRGCPGIEELNLSGTANTAWVEGLEDRWWQKTWAEFDEVYDPMDEFPPTLVARFGEHTERDESPLMDHPGITRAVHLDHHGTLSQMLDERDYEEMVTYLEQLDADKVGTAWHRWLLAVAESNLGHEDEALTLCELVLEEYPDFVSGQLLRANLLASTGDDDACLEALKAAVESGSDDPRAHTWLSTRLVGLGRFDEAKQSMISSIRGGVAPAELEQAAFMLTRAEHGPEWTEVHEFRSRNYVVRSDLSDKVAAEVGKELELSLAMYNRLFGSPKSAGSEELYPVYLFSGRSGYLAYSGDLFGSAPVATAGVYSPVLGQLLIWNLPDREDMLNTARHEGFHQYLDRLVDDPPIWFNEGTAEYVATAALKRGTMTPGEPVGSHVRLLADADTEWVPLDELFAMEPRVFQGRNTYKHYAESWAVIHYLQHEGRDESAMFDAYLEALLEGLDGEAAAERAFGDTDMNTLQRKVRDHVRALRER